MKHSFVIALLVVAAPLTALAGPFGSAHVEAEHLAGATPESVATLVEFEMAVLQAEVRLATLELELGPKKVAVKKSHTGVQDDRQQFKKAERRLKVATAGGQETERRMAQAEVDRHMAAIAASQRYREWLQAEVAVQQARIEAAEAYLEVERLRRDRVRAKIIADQQLRHASLHPVKKYEQKFLRAGAEYEFAERALEQARGVAGEVKAAYEAMLPGRNAEPGSAPAVDAVSDAPAPRDPAADEPPGRP